MSNRNDLILYITRVGFYMDDLRLFLDTHPQEAAAIKEYNRCAAVKHELIGEYTQKYGPFNWSNGNTDCSEWKWVTYPWPWEGACE